MSNNQQWFWLKNKERLSSKKKPQGYGLIKRDRTFETYIELAKNKKKD